MGKQLDQTNKLTVQPTIGVGVAFKGIAIDYAFTDVGNLSGALYSNVFSLSFDLNFKDK